MALVARMEPSRAVMTVAMTHTSSAGSQPAAVANQVASRGETARSNMLRGRTHVRQRIRGASREEPVKPCLNIAFPGKPRYNPCGAECKQF